MITMEPLCTTVSDETLHILRRFYPPPDDTADKLLYEGDERVRYDRGNTSCSMEKRMESISSRDRGHIRHPSPKEIQEEVTEVNSMVISR